MKKREKTLRLILSELLDQTDLNEYIEWNRERIISCLIYLNSNLNLNGLKTLDLGHDTHVGLLMSYLGCRLRGNVAPDGIPKHETASGSFSFKTSVGQEFIWPLDEFDFEGRFPYEDNSFELVTALEVIEHISTSPREFLNEVKRVLVPGGYFFIATPNAACWAKIMRQFSHAPVSDSRAYSKDWGPRHPMCHVYEYTPWEIKELLKTTGFEIISLATWDVYPSDPKGVRSILLRGLLAVSLAISGHLRESALLFRRRGHQLGILAKSKKHG